MIMTVYDLPKDRENYEGIEQLLDMIAVMQQQIILKELSNG
jgi:hypothetical protein